MKTVILDEDVVATIPSSRTHHGKTYAFRGRFSIIYKLSRVSIEHEVYSWVNMGSSGAEVFGDQSAPFLYPTIKEAIDFVLKQNFKVYEFDNMISFIDWVKAVSEFDR